MTNQRQYAFAVTVTFIVTALLLLWLARDVAGAVFLVLAVLAAMTGYAR